jgi:hypothetical protein
MCVKIPARSSILAAVLLMLALAPFSVAQLPYDDIPPVTTATPVDTDGDGYITGLALAATDDVIGVKEIHYSIDGATESVVNADTVTLGPFSAEPGESKTVEIVYYAEDLADNTEDAHLAVHLVDACPDQSAIVGGIDRDADNDGCPEIATNLCEDILASDVEPGVRNSLWKKCLNAEDAYVRGRDNAGNGLLDALINDLLAQRDQAVPAALADAWIARAQAVISQHA